MKTISLKLPEDLLDASSRCADALRISRASYVRAAIERMNRRVEMHLRAKRLVKASYRVRDESMLVNAEFSAIEKDLDA